jgi:hypothetical protein
MAIEYLLVTFSEPRAVLADGAGVGFTNHILMLPGDEYEITLEGNACSPASRVIALAGTSQVKPMVISFDLVASTTMARSGGSVPMTSDLARAKPRAATMVSEPAKSVASARKKTGKRRTTKLAQPTVVKTAGAKPAIVKSAAKPKDDA